LSGRIDGLDVRRRRGGRAADLLRLHGVIAGAVGALFYNVFAGMVGGVEVQTE
jgi:hypothetical protein